MAFDTQNQSNGKPGWTTPELVRLGTLRDIAKGPVPFSQANRNKRS